MPERDERGRFLPGHSRAGGRVKTEPDKNTVVATRKVQAHEAFGELWPVARSKIVRHLSHHSEAIPEGQQPMASLALDCATCRHYITIIVEYTFGKATQRVEFDLRSETERMLRDLNIEPTPEAMSAVVDLAQERARRAM